jgi:hypothetical protein
MQATIKKLPFDPVEWHADGITFACGSLVSD